jgi:hypothetical protein
VRDSFQKITPFLSDDEQRTFGYAFTIPIRAIVSCDIALGLEIREKRKMEMAVGRVEGHDHTLAPEVTEGQILVGHYAEFEVLGRNYPAPEFEPFLSPH